MAGAGVDRLKFRLGLPSSRIGAAHPLKACPKCIREELEQIGCAYWHLLQQHPAVWICKRHDELLMRSTGRSKTHNKLQWILPHTLAHNEWKHLPYHFEAQSLLLARLCEYVYELRNVDGIHFDPFTLRQCYLFGAKDAGWLTRSGSVRLKSMRQEFLHQTVGLLGIPEFDFIETADRVDGGFLAKLLRSARSHLHPTKHLVVKAFLFGSWREFWNCYIEMASTSKNLVTKNYSKKRPDPRVDELLALVASRHAPLAQIARYLELPYDVARYWLKRAGVRYVPPSAQDDSECS
jgi:hypothetical protein